MADKNVKIGIETTANTSGAEKAVVAIDDVVDKGKELDAVLEPKPGGGLEKIPEVAKPAEKSIRELKDEVRRLERELEELPLGSSQFVAMAGKVKAAERSLQDANAQANKLGASMSGSLNGKFQQAGFQIQDFAVQVGAGTSAMTAFGQQAPQFLGAFGPAGSIAGAIIAIGAVAYNVFSKMGGDVQTAKEKLDEMDEAIDKIAKNKTDELNQEFADTATAFDRAAARAAALKTGIEEVTKAENKLALARLDRQAQEREFATAAANKKATDEGKPVDNKRVADDAALRITERAAELARQGAEAEVFKINQAREAALLEAQKVEAAKEAQQKAIELLAAERERLGILREQRDELLKQAEERDPGDDPGLQLLGGIFPAIVPKSEAAKEAQKKIDDPNRKAEMAVLEKRIALIEGKVTGDDAELNKNVAELDVAYLAARTKVANLVAAAKTNTEAINLELGTVQSGQEQKQGGVVSQEQRDAEQELAKKTREVTDAIIKQIPDEALPGIKEITDKLQNLLKDGQQEGETSQADALLKELALKLERNSTGNSEVFQKILNNTDSALSTFQGLKSRVDEQARQIKGIQSQLSNPNP